MFAARPDRTHVLLIKVVKQKNKKKKTDCTVLWFGLARDHEMLVNAPASDTFELLEEETLQKRKTTGIEAYVRWSLQVT